MYYLKCSQCGKLNQVKSEYLTFCSGCSKKLNNSFAEWKKVNQDKSFDDYKNELCILDPEIDNSLIQKQPKSKNAKYIIVSIIAFSIFSLIGHFGSEAIIKIIKSEKTSEEVLKNNWIKETYGSFGLAVETPVKLKKDDIPLPDNIKQMIEVMDVYSNMSDKGLKIMINSIKYTPQVGQTSLQGAANGSINEMKLQNGVSNFKYSEEDIVKNNIPGFLQNGTYKQDGIDIEFINAGFAEGLFLWQIMVAYQMNDSIGRTAAKRVIESIEIKR